MGIFNLAGVCALNGAAHPLEGIYGSMSPYRPTSSYMTGYAPQAAPASFQLADFVRIVSARRWLMLRVALGVMVLATLIALLLPRQYTSSAVVMLDQRKNNITDLSAVLSQLPTDPATLQNQIQILTSRELAAKVIARLQLYNDPEFNPVLAPAGSHRPDGLFSLELLVSDDSATGDVTPIHDRILDQFPQACFGGSQRAFHRHHHLCHRRTIRKKAQSIANALAQAYVDDQVTRKRRRQPGHLRLAGQTHQRSGAATDAGAGRRCSNTRRSMA